MKQIFLMELGVDEETGVYQANVISTADNKGRTSESPNLKLLLVEVSKQIRKRQARNRKFPIAEPNRILTVDQAGVGAIITPGRN